NGRDRESWWLPGPVPGPGGVAGVVVGQLCPAQGCAGGLGPGEGPAWPGGRVLGLLGAVLGRSGLAEAAPAPPAPVQSRCRLRSGCRESGPPHLSARLPAAVDRARPTRGPGPRPAVPTHAGTQLHLHTPTNPPTASAQREHPPS